MTITTSKAALFVDNLLALLATSPTFVDPIRLYDGPAATDDGWTDAVFIGFDGDWQGTFEGVLINQTEATTGLPPGGGVSRYETVDVRCAAIAWSGDIAPKPCRDRANILLAAVETALRTDPTVGMGGSTIAIFDVGTIYQEPFQSGHGCRILFNVHVKLWLPGS